jgi:hypothetical protein
MFEINLTFSRGFQTTESADRIAATAQKSFIYCLNICAQKRRSEDNLKTA